MAIITKNDIQKLHNFQGIPCISIYIPTHRSREVEVQKKDKIMLKNQLDKVASELLLWDMNQNEIKALLEPANKLIEESLFWSELSDGLAIFMAKDVFRRYTLPVHFESFSYISNEFYLKPLVPMLSGDGRFFVLTLDLKGVKFFEGTRYSMTNVVIDDLVPARLEDAVGHDYEQKSLQFRSQQEGFGEAIFHGHGEGKEDRKLEVTNYFKAVDRGLMKMLHDERVPMVIAGLDHMIPLYRAVNTYSHVSDEQINHNPDDLDALELHRRALKIVGPQFDSERNDKLAVFQQLHGTGRTSNNIAEVLMAAGGGRVDTLFLENRSDIWGLYDSADHQVQVHDKHTRENKSLMNDVAVETLLRGGEVYLLEKDEMPDRASKINALFRY
jgi:hypothetical protein